MEIISNIRIDYLYLYSLEFLLTTKIYTPLFIVSRILISTITNHPRRMTRSYSRLAPALVLNEPLKRFMGQFSESPRVRSFMTQEKIFDYDVKSNRNVTR